MIPDEPSTVVNGSDVEAVRRPLSQAGHAPGAIYSSEEIFKREISSIFMQDWLYVGRVEEVGEPG